MADEPVTQALLYDPTASNGKRFTKLGKSEIPRLYHSVSILLPSGEVLIAGSNPDVFYAPKGNVEINTMYPRFWNNGKVSYLHQQQPRGVDHPTEYRVEIFAPPYMDAASRPTIKEIPKTINIGKSFNLTIDDPINAQEIRVRLSHSGFVTHANGMGQRMVELTYQGSHNTLSVQAPGGANLMPPGVYLIWVIADGVPSEGRWVQLDA